MFDLLISNGRVVTKEGTKFYNIAVKDGKIAAILSRDEKPQAMEVIDTEGKLIFPGLIDTHAHLNEPGYEWREDYCHGTKAAAVGGFTTIIDMPLQNEPAMTNRELLIRKKETVSKNAYVDFCFWGGLIPGNFNDLIGMAKEGAVAFKSFIGPVSPDYSSLNYGEILEAMKITSEFGIRIGFHCEDYSVIKNCERLLKEKGCNDWKSFLQSRPESAELIATEAVLRLSEETGAPVHICHVSSAKAANAIEKARENGIDVTCETCTHYLSMIDEDVIKGGPLFKCAPPLRGKDNLERMWEKVNEEVFAGIGSDHSPCTYDEKFTEILGSKIENVFDVWGGISGIQSGIQVLYSEGFLKRNVPLEKIVFATSYSPAKAFGIYGVKGDIKPGFDADFVILDPEKEWEIKADELQYKNKISAFTGMKGKGLPVMTIVRGRKVSENGKIVVSEPSGKFIPGKLMRKKEVEING